MRKIIAALAITLVLLGLGYTASKPKMAPEIPAAQSSETASDTAPVAETPVVPVIQEKSASSKTPVQEKMTAPSNSETSVPPTAPVATPAPKPTGKTVTVSYQGGSFLPPSITISPGDSIVFENNHSSSIFVASDPHPIHTTFPELDSGSVDPGAHYTFTASKKAVIHYHNHFNPGAKGEITIQ